MCKGEICTFQSGHTPWLENSWSTHNQAETDFHIFVRGGVDKYLGGGCCCLLWPGRGGNAWKGQGKSLTKFVF